MLSEYRKVSEKLVRTKHLILQERMEQLGQRDGSVTKCSACYLSGPRFSSFPASTWWFTAICNSSSMRYDALFCPLWVPAIHMVHLVGIKKQIILSKCGLKWKGHHPKKVTHGNQEKYFCRFFCILFFTVFYRHPFRANTHTHKVYFTVKRSFFDKWWQLHISMGRRLRFRML